MSDGFERHVCVDISARALAEARRRLGARGLILLSDIRSVPLRTGMADAVLALHSLYHLPPAGQRQALEEVCRILRPGGVGIIVYSWGSRSLASRLGRVLARRAFTDGRLFAFNHPPAFFTALKRSDCSFEMRCWSALPPNLTRAVVPHGRIGHAVLRAVSWVESRFPASASRYGQYPMIVIRKRGGAP
jgi:SAM-dependent methyltransferase